MLLQSELDWRQRVLLVELLAPPQLILTVPTWTLSSPGPMNIICYYRIINTPWNKTNLLLLLMILKHVLNLVGKSCETQPLDKSKSTIGNSKFNT